MKQNRIIFLILLIPSALFAQGISGTWRTASSAGFTARTDLTSSVVNGKIYAIGGRADQSRGANYGALSTLEVYDAATDTWSTPTTTGTFTPRWGACSCVVDGKIYVLGGGLPGGLSNILEVFNPATNSWSTPATTGNSRPRSDFAASVVGGKIYTFGGTAAGYQDSIVSTIGVFDLATNTWSTDTTTGPYTPLWGLTSSVVNGKIYVIGGSLKTTAVNTVEVFDPSTNSWSTPATTGTFTARFSLTSSVLDGKIYAVGGSTWTVDALDIMEVFDPATNSWSTPNMTGKFTPRAELSSSVVGNSIYVLGGYDDSSVLNSNEYFTPTSSSVIATRNTQDIPIFPNPISQVLHIELPPGIIAPHVQLLDFLGRVVGNSSEGTLDVSRLEPGRYEAVVHTSGGIVTEPVIVQH